MDTALALIQAVKKIGRYRCRGLKYGNDSDSRKRPESHAEVSGRERQIRLPTTSRSITPKTPEPETTEERLKRLEKIIVNLSRQNNSTERMAKSWYHGLQNYNLTWDEWKARVQRSFPDHMDYTTLLENMLGRRKDPAETMTTYYFKKMELLRSCDIKRKQAVSCLIHGIDDPLVQNGARAGRYRTPEDLYEEYFRFICNDSFYLDGKGKTTTCHRRH
ncbi:hypothetical protein NQ318_011196 [Aromia moschata]|uniref:Retrotransposon gag domain-containing protein n=1 Tax=Aromia moschata TaxID=1265417 RepID=A0AAV8X226_9CUCU|nr:hypothetical protein NQ318_011196 [Aromia moschata]